MLHIQWRHLRVDSRRRAIAMLQHERAVREGPSSSLARPAHLMPPCLVCMYGATPRMPGVMVVHGTITASSATPSRGYSSIDQGAGLVILSFGTKVRAGME